MSISSSQCGGSGCESGWTLYLDQSSSYSQTRCQNFGGDFKGKRVGFVVEEEDDDDEKEEDLSMVSDASSGPRHYWEDNENGSFCYAVETPEPVKKTSSKNKRKMKENGDNRQHSCLDDTASSPEAKNIKKDASMDMLDFSQSFSGTHFKGKSALQKKYSFMKSGKAAGSKDAGGFQERNWE